MAAAIRPLFVLLDLQGRWIDHGDHHDVGSRGKPGAGSDGQVLHGSILQIELDLPAARAVAGDCEIDRAVLVYRAWIRTVPSARKDRRPHIIQ